MQDPTPEEIKTAEAFLLDEDLPSKPVKEPQEKLLEEIEKTLDEVQQQQKLRSRSSDSSKESVEPESSGSKHFEELAKTVTDWNAYKASDRQLVEALEKVPLEEAPSLEELKFSQEEALNEWSPCEDFELGGPPSDPDRDSDLAMEELSKLWPTAPDVSRVFRTGPARIPTSAEYHPAVTLPEDEIQLSSKTASRGDYPVELEPQEGPVGFIRAFAERRMQKERELAEWQQKRREAAKTAETLSVLEIIEWVGPDGSAFYMLAPETRRQVIAENPSVEPTIHWVEGPVWAAIHKMTGWPAAKIRSLDIRIRLLPPI